MAVKFCRSFALLALLNVSLCSFAKSPRSSERNVYLCLGGELSEGEVFQYESNEKASEEERVLAAIAKAEESGDDTSGWYAQAYHQSQTDSFSDDTTCSDRLNPQEIEQPLSTNENQHQHELGITDVIQREGNSSSLTKGPLSKAQMKQTTTGTNQPTSSGLDSERWQPRTSQSTLIRKGDNVHKQSTIPMQRVKGSLSDTSKGRKPSSATTPWIRQYLISRPRDVLLPVPKDFIADGFNVARLGPIVERIGFQAAGDDAVVIAKKLMQVSKRSYPIFRIALQLILNENEDDNSILQHSIPPQVLQVAAEALYLMIHSRFCQSARGLDSLKRILRVEMFGKCPRVSCGGAPLLPYGESNDFSGVIRNSFCRRFCPKCGEVWIWWDSKTDGCAFGPSLCHLFLLTHGAEIYPMGTRSSKDVHNSRAPFRVMGFRIHPGTRWGRPITRTGT